MEPPELVRAFLEDRDTVLGFILALTRDADAAEEVFQEVGLAVVNEAARGTSVADFGRWVREIARHRTADYYRRRTRAGALAGTLEEAVCQAFEEAQISREDARLRERFLAECLDSISGRAREAIERRYRDGMSLAAIASAIGWQAASVKVALSRARKALFDCIQAKLRSREAAQHG